MHHLLRKVSRVYREEGIVSLARQSTSYGVNRTRNWLRALTWRARGSHELSIAGIRTNFHAGSLTESEALRFQTDTERRVLADLLVELGSGDTFFDVGANIGVYTCFAAAVLPAERVVAFEPHPLNVERLSANLALNDREADIRELALSDTEGTANLAAALRPGWQFGSFGDDQEGLTVETATGDALVQRGKVPQPTVVKIDVEGAEPLVVEGMQDTLADPACRRVYLEVHRRADHRRSSAADFGATATGLSAKLEDLGFTVEPFLDRGDEVYLKARR